MSELIRCGTRVYYTLSGEIDDDSFLTSKDMSESHWNLLMNCHHSGQCDEDAQQACGYFEIANYDKALEYLLDCGIESDRFKDDEGERDDDAVIMYYLWMLSGDIQELEEE